jgi:hypothetical protein
MEVNLAISALTEQRAIEGYIASNGNKTAAYQAAHPEADYDTARCSAGKFLTNHNIQEKAIAVLEANKVLNQSALLESLQDECKATKSLLYKGKEHITPDYSTRLAAKRTVLLDLYGLGKDKTPSTAIQNNIVINQDGINKVTDGLSNLFEKANSLIDKLNNAKEI